MREMHDMNGLQTIKLQKKKKMCKTEIEVTMSTAAIYERTLYSVSVKHTFKHQY